LKAIEAKMEKIVQLPDKVIKKSVSIRINCIALIKENQRKAIDEINMDFAKMITEQYQKQMAKQNAIMEELKKASVAIPDISKLGNLDQQVALFIREAYFIS
jgi:hypothetical protein